MIQKITKTLLIVVMLIGLAQRESINLPRLVAQPLRLARRATDDDGFEIDAKTALDVGKIHDRHEELL